MSTVDYDQIRVSRTGVRLVSLLLLLLLLLLLDGFGWRRRRRNLG